MDSRQPSSRGTPTARPTSRRAVTPLAAPPPPQYIVYIKLPYPRGTFVDPPQVDWDATKERYLWRVLSRDRNREVDWDTLADQLAVTRPFLLQQAAWLYERELSQIQAQMRRAAIGSTPSTPQTPHAMLRTPSKAPLPTSHSRPQTATNAPVVAPQPESPVSLRSSTASSEVSEASESAEEEEGGAGSGRRRRGFVRDSSGEEELGQPAFLPFSVRRERSGGVSEMESMGSSYSDLSEASVTQSQLEEAYLSTFKSGGMTGTLRGLGRVGGMVRSRWEGKREGE